MPIQTNVKCPDYYSNIGIIKFIKFSLLYKIHSLHIIMYLRRKRIYI